MEKNTLVYDVRPISTIRELIETSADEFKNRTAFVLKDNDKLYEKRYHPYTEALLSAIPQVDASEQKERIHLSGEVPSPSNPPSGCRFHTRCPKACERCSCDTPELREIEPGHFVACHLYD